MVTKQGLYIVNNDGKNVLMYNGKRICTKLAGTLRRFGLHIDGDTLEVDGCVVAKTSATPKIKVIGDEVYFGDVQLVEKNECVNITEEDYNTLISGGSVDGYKTYSPTIVYNIVADPATAETVTYNVVDDSLVFQGGGTLPKDSSGIYNSATGELAENTEDLVATINNPDCPNVHVRYFNPVIAVGDTITLDYFVDTRKMSSIHYSTLNDTFTLVVNTPYGVVKQTTYAGFYQVTLPAFNESGIKWFTVRCIDSNGVGSEEQFFDVLVKAPHTDVVYTMTAADLEPFEYNGNTYQIIPDDNTVSVAIANKAALSAFFEKVKASGYDRIIMLNRTYWLDYHQKNGKPKMIDNKPNGGNYMTFPDSFTVDLNGATIAATQCNDIAVGELVNFNGNTDTHLINGVIKGNLDGFDFAAARQNISNGSSCEWLSVVSMTASKYCSFENLDVSGAVGFDARLKAINTNVGNWLSDIGLYDNSSIDLSTGQDVVKSDMVRSGYFVVSGREIISFGRNGYNMYLDMGPERILFFCFYDTNDNYLGFIKSHFYRMVKVPVGAAKARFVGYGKIAVDASNDTDWKTSSVRGELMVFRPQLCRNNVTRNCHWHDTRTTAITNMTARGHLLENCTYENVSLGTGSVVTPLLGDLEDSWQWASNLYIKGCRWIPSSGQSQLKVYYAKSFEFIGNSGFSFYDAGGIESGVIEDNTMSEFLIDRNRSCYFPSVVMRNNSTGSVSVSYGYFKGNPVNWTHHQAERIVAMTDSTINKECRYDNLLLRRCKNGNIIVD